jgi:hypothetical protein
VRSLTSVVRRNVSIGSGRMNLAFVHRPAARTLRHSPARSMRQISLGPGSRPPSSNNASFVERFRGCADGNMETQRLRAIQHPNRATILPTHSNVDDSLGVIVTGWVRSLAPSLERSSSCTL